MLISDWSSDVCSSDLGDAFEIIMRRHNRMLFRVARSIVRNDAEAEDVVQETYVRAYARLGDFEGASRLSTWPARLAINEADRKSVVQGKSVAVRVDTGGGRILNKTTTRTTTRT